MEHGVGGVIIKTITFIIFTTTIVMIRRGLRGCWLGGSWARGGDHQNHHLYNDRDDQAGVERLLAGWKLGLVDQLEAGLYRWSVGGRDDG